MKEPPKPLYIHAREPVQVCLDGPALRIRKRCSSDGRFPLGRLSRVVAIGEVSWAVEALLACGDAGIVVCELRPDGLPGRCWIGRPSRPSTFTEDWQHFLDRPGAHHAYGQWGRNARRRAIQLCALCLGLNRQATVRVLRGVGGWAACDGNVRAVKRLVYGLAYARCLEELAKLGLCDADPSLRLLVPHLVTVTQWGLHPSLCRDWRRGELRCALAVVELFERNQRTIDFHLRDALTRLARLIQERA